MPVENPADGDADADADGDGPMACDHFESHDGMVSVSAGEFWMGCNPENAPCAEDSAYVPYHAVFLDGYLIDQSEATVDDYASCVNAGACARPSTGGLCNWGVEERGAHPVNCVTWDEAAAYCEWASKRLCTEAEWEKAARGVDGREYPWGNDEPTCELAVLAIEEGTGCGAGSTSPVVSRPRSCSPYGAFDMIGNVQQWVGDYYEFDYYGRSPYENPLGPERGRDRVIRGASFRTPPGMLSTVLRGVAGRLGVAPYLEPPSVGIRCCRDR